ncbi:spore gernimation protein GerA [Sulfoacidibacillus thermotolerans]|uniref:Spore gernimation protein GerA n=2 Tax=Sulfoacidibacillus thermotolerans TaxID=1765684 RepID=A0A2U3DA29_SULT2|nr:spore gernimation protein GerA [Sulfoacidibacillus thermotolerans]
MEALSNVNISANLEENDAFLKELLGIGVSWDLIAKPFVFADIKMTAYTANGYFLTMNMVLIVENLEMTIKEFVDRHPNRSFTLDELVNYLNVTIGFVQVQIVTKMSDAVRFILSGPLVIFIEGYEEVLMIDTRIYPMRSIDEPAVERIVRGPRDGFVETMLMNVALIRRRLRDPRLRVELLQIGARSQTDVSLMYLQDVTNDQLVDRFRQALKSIPTDIVAMGEQAVTEWLGKVGWNPYPIVRYTERPDVAATGLLEGQVVVVVDTTPEVIVGPTTVFHHLHHPEDYHSYPIVGLYLRIGIILASFISVLAPGFFIVLAAEHDHLPKAIAFLGTPKPLPLPLGLQFLMAQLGVDLFERAVINTPSTLASAIGIVSGLVFGQFATMMNLVSPEVLVFMGGAAIAQFATSSRELSSANRLMRLLMIVLSWIFGGIGFTVGIVFILVLLLRTRALGVPYLWPLFPFDWQGAKALFVRPPLYKVGKKSSIFKTKD